tara:strand:+ start:734 stop:1192 length:459 start_codon:yes stop_codon:yes gene_type:complete
MKHTIFHTLIFFVLILNNQIFSAQGTYQIINKTPCDLVKLHYDSIFLFWTKLTDDEFHGPEMIPKRSQASVTINTNDFNADQTLNETRKIGGYGLSCSMMLFYVEPWSAVFLFQTQPLENDIRINPIIHRHHEFDWHRGDHTLTITSVFDDD